MTLHELEIRCQHLGVDHLHVTFTAGVWQVRACDAVRRLQRTDIHLDDAIRRVLDAIKAKQ